MVATNSMYVQLFTGTLSTSVDRCMMYGKPLEIWKDEHIPEGPAMFLPIHKLECRCVAAHSTIPVPSIGMSRDENDAIQLPGGAEERESPLPGLKF